MSQPSTCGYCGAPLSMPAESCQNCHHPITLVDDSVAIDRTFTRLDDGDTPPDVATTQVCSLEEARRVDELLRHIASQSHYEDRYEIRNTLATGGMGQVLRAYDRILRRDVAIKMMRDDFGVSCESAAVRGQFLKEARVGGRLLHPHILAVFDLGVNRSGQIYYTMRLVDGASMQHCLVALEQASITKLITYPLRRVVEAFVGACQGIDFAHQNGVIHLDLKPQNVLVSGFNEVFVIDWGLAKVDEVDDTEQLADLYRDRLGVTNTASNTLAFGGRIVGTPGYMAPEQGRGDYHAFDATTDVYGLGGILHFILFAKAPNQGRDARQIIEALCSASRKKVEGRLREGILPRGRRVKKEAQTAVVDLLAICMRAIEFEQDQRYPNVEPMIIELNEWLLNTPQPPAGF